MPLVLDTTTLPNESEMIYGYRTSADGAKRTAVSNSCDIEITLKDPFDFEIEWQWKKATIRVPYRDKRNHKRYRYIKTAVKYPWFIFKEKTLTIRQWRKILSIGLKTLGEINRPDVIKRQAIMLKKLERKLRKYGPCRSLVRSRNTVQNPVTHIKSTTTGLPVHGTLELGVHNIETPFVTNSLFGYRLWELPVQYTGQDNGNLDLSFQQQMYEGYVSAPSDMLFSHGLRSLIFKSLRPGSGDFADRDASPVIDVAEAVADGTILGPPPSPSEAAKDLARTYDKRDLENFNKLIDFTANAHLWKTLVLEPVLSAASGLAASVKANDEAIEAFTSKAKQDGWHQGKSWRVYNDNPGCFYAPVDWNYTDNASYHNKTSNATVNHEKFSGNAQLYYKLDFMDAARMNTSGVRLGQFFQRLSSDLELVAWNIITLSFVFDWFSHEVSGNLNLKDKVNVPLKDWKLVMSHNVKGTIDIRSSTKLSCNVWAVDYVKYCCGVETARIRWNTLYAVKSATYPEYSRWYNTSSYCKGVRCQFRYEYYILDSLEVENESYIQEKFSHYERRVYNKFDLDETAILSDYPCITTDKEPTDDQWITLGALLWSFGPTDKLSG